MLLLLFEQALERACFLPGLVARLAYRLAVLAVPLGLAHPVRALLPKVLIIVELRRYAAMGLLFLGNSATIPGLLILLARGQR